MHQNDDSDLPAVETEIAPEDPYHESFCKFVRLTVQKRRLNAEVKSIEDKLAVLGLQLRDYISARPKWGGLRVIDPDLGDYSVYLRRQLYVRHYEFASAAEVCEALKRNGMGVFVKEMYNSSELSNHIRQLEDLHKGELKSGEMESIAQVLPADVTAVLNINPKYSVVAMRRQKD
jgi:hypothetical protein